MLLVTLSFGTSIYILPELINQSKSFENNLNLKGSGHWEITGRISIDDTDTGVSDWATINATYDWCNGAGTIDNPYVIENVTINAGNSGSCISILNSNSAYFIVRNCTLIDGGSTSLDSGIYMNSVQNGLIENNTCYNSRCGIVLEACSYNIVMQNYVYGTSFVGIYLYDGNDNEAHYNTIIGTNRGLGLYDESNANFTENTFSNTGIYISGDDTQVNTHSIDSSNLVNGRSIYYLVNESNLDNTNFTDPGQIILANCDDCQISGFQFNYTNIAIQIFYSKNTKVFDNEFSDVFTTCVYIHGNDKSNISGNNFDQLNQGIIFYDTINSSIENNNFTSCSTAISLQTYSHNNTVENNIMLQCPTSIYIASSDDNWIEDNDMNGLGNYGSYITYSANNTFFLNSITGFNRGIFIISNSDSNVFRENLIKSSSTYGVDIYDSTCEENIFFENSFEDNNLHLNDDGTNNYYNNSEIGNYWDNYTGTDENDDGIGDNPFEIQAGIFDYLPIFDDGYDHPIPIHIDNNWSETVAVFDWVIGNGTWEDPYIIENITIDAQGSGSGILIENSDDFFIIRNCTIHGTSGWNAERSAYDAGIALNHANNGQIYNNTIYDNEYAAIYLQYSDNNSVCNNSLYMNDNWGIDIRFSSDNDIINNSVQAAIIDIGFYYSESNIMRDNDMGQSGFFLRASTLNQANSHDIDLSNIVNGKTLYYYVNQEGLSTTNFSDAAQIFLVNCTNVNISGMEFDHSYRTISMHYSSGNNIEYCNFSSNNDVFIRLSYCEGNIIQNNRFQNDNAIYLEYSSLNHIRYNELISTGLGIQIAGYSDSNQIYENTIEGGSRGIGLYTYCDSNLIYSNNVSDVSLYGILLYRTCELNQVFNNNVSDCDAQGIRIENADNNYISDNIIISNELGVYLDSNSDLNGVYNNTFKSNVKHAEDLGNNNYWNTSIGNYWDNYTGTDVNDDRIGDIPFEFQTGIFDYLPKWDDGDDLGPIISIISPSNNSYCGTSPTIEISTTDPSGINETWYAILGSSENYFFTGDSFEVNATSWTEQDDGLLIVRVYANDSLGNLAFKDIIFIKDTLAPQIIITEPTNGTIYEDIAPTVRVTITEANIDKLWFTINDDTTKYYILSPISGVNEFSIDYSTWEELPDGDYILRIHVNDTLGNSNSIYLRIIKDTSNPTPSNSAPPGIPGYEVGTLVAILGIVSVIIGIKQKRANKH